MESQEDRFIRQFMLIEDDRKERNFDHKSIERKQRIMPQGQIDLGIYPDGDNEEPIDPEEPIFYGFRMPISEPQVGELTYDQDNDVNFFKVTENIEDKNCNLSVLVISAENITVSNSKIGFVIATPENILGFPTYPARFENCSLYTPEVNGSPNFQNCVFYRCDFDNYINTLIEYVNNSIIDKNTVVNILNAYLFNSSNTFIDCKTSSLDDYPELDL